MRRAAPFALLLLGAAAAGCEMAWDLANRGELKRDVRKIIEPHGVDVTGGTCHMIGASREGYCVFRASAQQVASLVGRLELREMSSGGTSREGAPYRPAGFDRGCRTKGFRQEALVGVYGTPYRPQTLRLKGVRGFDYLLLFAPPTAGEICVQVSYAYG